MFPNDCSLEVESNWQKNQFFKTKKCYRKHGAVKQSVKILLIQ